MWSIASFCVWQQVKYCSFEVEGGGLRVHYAYYGLADSEVETKKAKRGLHTQLCLFLILVLCKCKDYAFLTSLKFHTHQFANWEKNSSTYAINWAKLPQSLWARDVKCRLCKRCLAANLSSPNSWKGYNWLNWRFWEMPTHQKSETFGAGYVCKLGIMDLWTLGRGAPRTCRL